MSDNRSNGKALLMPDKHSSFGRHKLTVTVWAVGGFYCSFLFLHHFKGSVKHKSECDLVCILTKTCHGYWLTFTVIGLNVHYTRSTPLLTLMVTALSLCWRTSRYHPHLRLWSLPTNWTGVKCFWCQAVVAIWNNCQHWRIQDVWHVGAKIVKRELTVCGEAPACKKLLGAFTTFCPTERHRTVYFYRILSIRGAP